MSLSNKLGQPSRHEDANAGDRDYVVDNWLLIDDHHLKTGLTNDMNGINQQRSYF